MGALLRAGIINLVCCLLFIGLTRAQTPKWIRGGATNQNFSSYNFKEEALFMCTDQNRNIYTLSIVGNSAITADTFSRPTGAYGSPKNVLLTSHNCNGQMRFAKLITSNSTVPYGVVADNSGHIYLAVDVPHYGTTSLTTFRIGYDTTITSHTNNRVALIQLDTTGNLNWLRYVGANNSATFSGTGGLYNYLALDGLGNAHLVAAANFGVNLTSSLISNMGYYDMTYDATGNLLSNNKVQIDSTLLIHGMTIDKQSNKMYVHGQRYIGMFPDSSRYPYLAALDVSRNRIWIDTFANPYYSGAVALGGIIADGYGNLYSTPNAARCFIFRGDTALNTISTGSSQIATIMKTDTAGNVKWIRTYSGNTAINSLLGISLMPNNKIATGGVMTNKVVCGLDTVMSYAGEGQNAYFTVVDSAGYVHTIQQLHGAGFYDNCGVNICDKVGNLYVSGKVESSVWAGSLSPYTTIGGDSDYFIFKYGVDCSCTAMPISNYSYSGTYLTRSFTYTGTMTGIDSVRWTFGDGSTSTSFTPTHTYPGAGTFTTCVRVYSSCGNDMRCHEVSTTCMSTPTASFIDTGNIDRGFTYTGTTVGYDSVVWDFGDGVFDTGLSVVRHYAVNDTYHVCAKVYTNCGTHTWCKDVIVTGWVSTNLVVSTIDKIQVYPNPSTNELYISDVLQPMDYRLINMVGTTLQSGTLHDGTNVLQMQQMSPGVYVLEMVVHDGLKRVVRIVKQ